jgi:hypothetical protein
MRSQFFIERYAGGLPAPIKQRLRLPLSVHNRENNDADPTCGEYDVEALESTTIIH